MPGQSWEKDWNMTMSRKLRLAILLLVLGCGVGCDQTSKHVARTELGQRGPVMLPGGFGELRLAENPGSFLSLGALFPQPLRLACFTVVVGAGLIALFAWLVGHARLGWISFIGIALAMAGGASNLIDRITRQGFVTDFIRLRVGALHTGIFNFADIMIMTGITVLTCALWKKKIARGTTEHES